MKYTSNGRHPHEPYHKIVEKNKTLKSQVIAALRISPHTSFELENGLNRLHQSVSSTLTRLEQAGVVEVKDWRSNEYGNECNVYSLVKGK